MQAAQHLFVPAISAAKYLPSLHDELYVTIVTPTPRSPQPFGPVLPIVRVKTVEQAIEHVNANRLALQVICCSGSAASSPNASCRHQGMAVPGSLRGAVRPPGCQAGHHWLLHFVKGMP